MNYVRLTSFFFLVLGCICLASWALDIGGIVHPKDYESFAALRFMGPVFFIASFGLFFFYKRLFVAGEAGLQPSKP